MGEQSNEEILERAVQLFLRLRDAPDDQDLIKQRDMFLASGAAERAAFAKAENAWRATRPKRRSAGLRSFLLLAMLGAATYAFYGDVRVLLLADLRTASLTESASLASGDDVTLDARSALIDNTDGPIRAVTLLDGAAFFDVERDEHRFIVSAGALDIEVIGTAFETALIDGGVIVTVASGVVEVRSNADTWQLQPGDRLTWTGDGANVDSVDQRAVASWREGQLVVQGMTFRQVADIIDRRLPGPVVILDEDLARSRVVGTFDLGDPELALRSLAAIRGAEVTSVTPLATFIAK
ncbi:MAG: FecR domain-containing protein [Pseudomonadota bacterium]